MNRTTIPPPTEGLGFWARGYFIRVDMVKDGWAFVRRWKVQSGQPPAKGQKVSYSKLPLAKWPKKTQVLLEENA